MTQSNQPLNDRLDTQSSTELNPATDEPQYRNDGSDYLQDDNARSTDDLETMGGSPSPTQSLPDSPSSESAAGLDDPLFDKDADNEGGVNDLLSLANAPDDAELVNDLEDSDVSEGLPQEPREIPMTDLADDLNPTMSVRTPEMSDLNVPGEVDIEELDAAALSDTDIPRDALLDPIEE